MRKQQSDEYYSKTKVNDLGIIFLTEKDANEGLDKLKDTVFSLNNFHLPNYITNKNNTTFHNVEISSKWHILSYRGLLDTMEDLGIDNIDQLYKDRIIEESGIL